MDAAVNNWMKIVNQVHDRVVEDIQKWGRNRKKWGKNVGPVVVRQQEEDDDASSVSTYDSAWSPRLCHADPEYAVYLLERARAKAHRDPVTGEIEECRFFNSAAGCRSGDQCPYKHIARDQQTIECRFFKSPRGCRNGAKCPFKH
jgi:hypothetical protein